MSALCSAQAKKEIKLLASFTRGVSAFCSAQAKKEIKLLASFNHPNIVRYRDSFLEMGKLHIVMDYAEGGELHSLLKDTAAAGESHPYVYS